MWSEQGSHAAIKCANAHSNRPYDGREDFRWVDEDDAEAADDAGLTNQGQGGGQRFNIDGFRCLSRITWISHLDGITMIQMFHRCKYSVYQINVTIMRIKRFKLKKTFGFLHDYILSSLHIFFIGKNAIRSAAFAKRRDKIVINPCSWYPAQQQHEILVIWRAWMYSYILNKNTFTCSQKTHWRNWE